MQNKRTIPRWLPAVSMMVIIFVFSSIPSASMPTFDVVDTLVKKGGHMLGYGLLAVAFWYAYQFEDSKKKYAWLLAVLYALTDEFHQTFVPGRNASLIDVGIDALGALLLLWFFTAWRKRK